MEIVKGDKIVIYGGEVKKVFNIHTNGNPLIKNEGTICQVPLNQFKKW